MRNVQDFMQPQAHMIQPQLAQQVEPTEKAQIVVTLNVPHPPTIVRFNSLKKGEAAYEKLQKAWMSYDKDRANGKRGLGVYPVFADMFDATFDLGAIICIAFVDHAKRNKFIPA